MLHDEIRTIPEERGLDDAVLELRLAEQAIFRQCLEDKQRMIDRLSAELKSREPN